MRTILSFAVIGTVISCIITAVLLLQWTDMQDTPQALLFGALISATDPVATLGVFRSVFHLDGKEYVDAPLLYDLVVSHVIG